MPRLEPWEHTTRQLIPHLSVRILSPSPLPVFPPLYPFRRSRVFSFLSLPSANLSSCAIALLTLSLASLRPLPSSFGGWFFPLARHLGSPCLPLPLSRMHPALMVKLFLCNYVCVRMHVAHTCSIILFIPASFSFSPSLSLSSSFFVKHNPHV